MLGIAGCSKQEAPGGEASSAGASTSSSATADAAPVDLKIVEQVQIDQDGKEVKAATG